MGLRGRWVGSERLGREMGWERDGIGEGKGFARDMGWG